VLTVEDLFAQQTQTPRNQSPFLTDTQTQTPEWWKGLLHNQPPHHQSTLRIGIITEFYDPTRVANDVLQANLRALLLLQTFLPVTYVKVSIPNLRFVQQAHSVKIASEFAHSWDVAFWSSKQMSPAYAYTSPNTTTCGSEILTSTQTRTRKQPSFLIEPNTRITAMIGTSLTSVETVSCNKLRAYLFRYVASKVFGGDEGVSFVLSPTVPQSAPPMFDSTLDTGHKALNLPHDVADILGNSVLTHALSDVPKIVGYMQHIFIGNLIGVPGLSVNVGFDGENGFMPVGLQILGRWWDDVGVSKLGMIVEALLR